MKSQLMVGLFGLIVVLALGLVFDAVYKPYSKELRGLVVWSDGGNFYSIGVTNTSWVDWYDFTIKIKYESVEYKDISFYTGNRPYGLTVGAGTSFGNSRFEDEYGNKLDLRAAMENGAVVEIVAKRGPDGENETVRIHRVVMSPITVTTTTAPMTITLID